MQPHEWLRQIKDSVDRDTSLTTYEKNVIRRYLRWSRLIPSQTILQTAGNMGAVSVGIGWHYGRHEQWETHLLMGYIPKHDAANAKLTMTLKQTYRPWQLRAYKDLYLEPLTAGVAARPLSQELLQLSVDQGKDKRVCGTAAYVEHPACHAAQAQERYLLLRDKHLRPVSAHIRHREVYTP